MSKTKNNTKAARRASLDAKFASAFSDLEGVVDNMRSAASLNEILIGVILKEVSGTNFCNATIKGFQDNGYRVYVLTKTQDEVLHHAIHHASDIARELYNQWHNSAECSA